MPLVRGTLAQPGVVRPRLEVFDETHILAGCPEGVIRRMLAEEVPEEMQAKQTASAPAHHAAVPIPDATQGAQEVPATTVAVAAVNAAPEKGCRVERRYVNDEVFLGETGSLMIPPFRLLDQPAGKPGLFRVPANQYLQLDTTPPQLEPGQRLLVYWPDDDEWYGATVREDRARRHHIVYDDGEKEWIDISRETVTLLDRRHETGASSDAAQCDGSGASNSGGDDWEDDTQEEQEQDRRRRWQGDGADGDDGTSGGWSGGGSGGAADREIGWQRGAKRARTQPHGPGPGLKQRRRQTAGSGLDKISMAAAAMAALHERYKTASVILGKFHVPQGDGCALSDSIDPTIAEWPAAGERLSYQRVTVPRQALLRRLNRGRGRLRAGSDDEDYDEDDETREEADDESADISGCGGIEDSPPLHRQEQQQQQQQHSRVAACWAAGAGIGAGADGERDSSKPATRSRALSEPSEGSKRKLRSPLPSCPLTAGFPSTGTLSARCSGSPRRPPP